MRVGQGANTYQWNEDWAKLPDTEIARQGWAHHGVVVTESGEVVTFNPGGGTNEIGSSARLTKLPSEREFAPTTPGK